MQVLREVITRFRLETKEEDVRNFNSKLGSMKSGLRSLAAAFGITLGVGGALAIARLGNNAERAEFNLKRLAGVNFQGFRGIFDKVKSDIEGIRAGASNTLRPKEFDQAAAGYVRVLGSSKDAMDAFGRIFEYAAKQSNATGESVVEITDSITKAIASGGFEALLDLPGFDQKALKMSEFVQGVLNPDEPGGQIAVQNRQKAILRIIQASAKDQNAALKAVPETLLTADSAANKLQESLEKLGTMLTKTLVPALEKLVELLNLIVGKFVDVNKGAAASGKTPGEYIASKALESFIGPNLDQPGAGGKAGKKAGISDRLRYLGYLPPFQVGATSDVQPMSVNNTFNIQSTDPLSTAREVEAKFRSSLEEARGSVPPTERR